MSRFVNRNGPWRHDWALTHGAGRLQIVDGPFAKPYLRVEGHAGVDVGFIENPRRLRAIAEAIINALDRNRPPRKRR
jgi:hypothetical protein